MLEQSARPLRLLTDFNAIRDGSVRGLVRDLSDAASAAIGAPVLLYDGQHTMRGRIAQLSENIVRADVYWTTWESADNEPQLRG
jgi:hypothetical protein